MGLKQLGQWEGKVSKAYLGLYITKVRWGGNKGWLQKKIVFTMHHSQAQLGAPLVLSGIIIAPGKHIFYY